MTPWVAAPGDTTHSDATNQTILYTVKHLVNISVLSASDARSTFWLYCTLQALLQVAVWDEPCQDRVARQRMQDVFVFCWINESASLHPLFSLLSVSPASNWPLNPATYTGFTGALLALSAERTTFAATRHIPWALNTPKMSAANEFLACLLQPSERVWCCKCRSISVKDSLKIEANVVVS